MTLCITTPNVLCSFVILCWVLQFGCCHPECGIFTVVQSVIVSLSVIVLWVILLSMKMSIWGHEEKRKKDSTTLILVTLCITTLNVYAFIILRVILCWVLQVGCCNSVVQSFILRHYLASHFVECQDVYMRAWGKEK
jgi:hypothetical protein